MKKTRILGIAPYDAIRQQMQQIAARRTDIELEVFIGDMEEGANIVSNYPQKNFDVIVSRGGTAQLIRSLTALPVIDIPLTIYDIFRSIKLAENYTSKYALVGFPNITKNAHFLCDMMQYDIDIYTIHDEEEAKYTLKKLQNEGCSMILCDMITNSLAQHYGLTSILITSGAESIESALDAAVQVAHSHEKLRTDLSFCRLILDNHPWPVAVFDTDGTSLLLTKPSELSESIIHTMKQQLKSVIEHREKKIYQEYEGLLYVLHGFHKVFHEKELIIYYINHRKVPLSLTKNGIYYINQEQAFDAFYNSFYGITHSATPQNISIEKYAQSSSPLIIVGEPGTGKEAIARLIYAKSLLRNRPMAVIDCSRIGDKGWTFLTEHNSSPLSDTNTTIYFQHISSLTDSQFTELLSIIVDLNLTKKNRIIITFKCDETGNMSFRCRTALNTLTCLLLEIPPLRTHLTELPNLLSLYINALNIKLAKEIIGIEPEGLRQIQAYQWPGNYDQLERIMNELVSSASGSYIRSSDVNKILKRELPHAAPSPAFDIHRTLDEINYDIICQVLAECGGNQSTAAKKLGIGRTTLWRILQRNNPSIPL